MPPQSEASHHDRRAVGDHSDSFFPTIQNCVHTLFELSQLIMQGRGRNSARWRRVSNSCDCATRQTDWPPNCTYDSHRLVKGTTDHKWHTSTRLIVILPTSTLTSDSGLTRR